MGTSNKATLDNYKIVLSDGSMSLFTFYLKLATVIKLSNLF